MKAAFYTLGCKVNQYETQVMEQKLIAAGYEIVGHEEPADVYIVNSCTVTGESDRKTRQILRRLKKQNPGAVTVLSGCFPQSSPEKAASIEEADVVTGVRGRLEIDRLIEEAVSSRSRLFRVSDFAKSETFEPMRAEGFEGHTRAFVKIEDGCRSFCSYCIIPASRGPIRSKPLLELKEELESLRQAGYQEAVLVGINLSAYGTDQGLALIDALETAESADGPGRIRLGSLEPNLITGDFLARASRLKKFCPHFHLSLQSGCEETLRRMNRRYTPEQYRNAVERLREAFPDCGITTDIIVGFPGETQEEFGQSLSFVRSVGFSQGHVFAYSRRAGTKAAVMPDQVEKAEKERRSRLMAEVCRASKEAFLESLAGTVQPVLFEETREDGFCEGFAPNYAPVRVRSETALKGLILDVALTGSAGDHCAGILRDVDC